MGKRIKVTRVPVKEEGEGPVRFSACPCEECGKPVTSLRRNIAVIMEDDDGKRFWSASHRRCAARKQEKDDRKAA